MDNNADVFNDIMEALHEVEEHQKGALQLKSDIVEIPDDFIISKFNQLSENDKYFVSGMIDRLLVSDQ